MPRSIVSVLMTTLLVLFTGHVLAFEPTLVEDPDRGWKSVQGGWDGNPLAPFDGDLSKGNATRERLIDVPAWIVSEDFDGDGTYEAVVQFAEGALKVMSFSGERSRTIATVRNMAPEIPPVVLSSLGGESTGGVIGVDNRGDLVSIEYSTGRTKRLASGLSPLSHLAAGDLDSDGKWEIAAVSDEGYMTVIKDRKQKRINNSVALLLDTRIILADLDGDQILEIVAFSQPVDVQSPGRLGDDLEAKALAVFNWDGRTLRKRSEFVLPVGQFFETLAPIVAGTDGDGEKLLMLPVTTESKGTQVRSYIYSGGRIREKRKGPLSDEDQWIHVLGSAKLGTGEREQLIVALVSEDDEGDLELYRLDLAKTKITLRSTVSTHKSGSRLLETVLIGDMNRDGMIEILAPGPKGLSLVLFTLDRNRLKGKEIFISSGLIGTNLCPGDFNGDGISDILFGLENGSLVVLQGE